MELLEIEDWQAYEAVYLDEEVVGPTIRALLEEAGVEYQTLERIRDGSNFVYRLDGGRLLKAYAPLFADELRDELSLMRTVYEANLGVRVPRILAEEEVFSWRFVIMECLEGEAGVEAWSKIPHGDRQGILEELGAFMVGMHRDERVQSLELGEDRADWSAAQRELRQGIVAKHERRGATPEWLELLEPFFEDWVACDDTKVIHADLHPGNLIFTRDGAGRWRLGGVLDFADVLRAPVLYDLAAPLLFMAGGDANLTRALTRVVMPECDVPTMRVLWHWILLHRYSNLAYYLKDAKNRDYVCHTLMDVCHALLGQ